MRHVFLKTFGRGHFGFSLVLGIGIGLSTSGESSRIRKEFAEDPTLSLLSFVQEHHVYYRRTCHLPKLSRCVYEQCDYNGYTPVAHANSHLKKKTKPLFNCAFCDYKAGYTRHRRNHHPVYAELFECLVCESLIPMAAGTKHLSDHVKARSDTKTTVRCFECSHTSVNMQKLSEHVRVSHYYSRPYAQCKYCTFKSKILKSYIKHVKICYSLNRSRQ